MALKVSTGLRDLMLTSKAFKECFVSGDATHKAEIRIFSGSAPATADAAETGTKLVTIKAGSNGVTFANSADGVILKTGGETWSGTIANTGDAAYYRLVEGTVDDGALSTTAPRVQGNVGLSSEADIQLFVSSKTLTSGQTQVIDSFQITFPGAPAS